MDRFASIDRPILLVLCTGNSCRSQMAEGFLRHYHGHQFDVRSAGTRPAPQVHPLAVIVMREVGLDIGAQYPKHSRDFLGRMPVRHLLIVCGSADASCPSIWPGTLTRTFMPFDDPAAFVGNDADTLAEFQRVRDQIGDAMRDFTPDPALWASSFENRQA